jgi:hypothetical protein
MAMRELPADKVEARLNDLCAHQPTCSLSERVMNHFKIATLVGLLGTGQIQAQGTFLVDQQAGADNASTRAGLLPTDAPFGQSFTPSLSFLDFITLSLQSISIFSTDTGNGSSLHVNIRSGAFTGPIVGTSSTAQIPHSADLQPVTFIFSTSVPLTPSTLNYFEVVLESGDTCAVRRYHSYGYLDGDIYINGTVNLGTDMWFREGIIVPEPSTWALWLVGGSALLCGRRFTRR